MIGDFSDVKTRQTNKANKMITLHIYLELRLLHLLLGYARIHNKHQELQWIEKIFFKN